MRPEIACADRRFAVRRAAASWQRAGAVTAEAHRQIDLLHADDRVRTGDWFRLLFFVFTLIGAAGLFGLLGLMLGDLDFGVLVWSLLLLLLAAGLAAVTEAILVRLRLRRFGVEEATGWLALGAAHFAVALAVSELDLGQLVLEEQVEMMALMLPFAVLAALAAYRWGLSLAGAAAAAALFVALAPLPAGLWLWILVALPLAWALERAAESPALAPAHRARAREGWWIALAALFVAVHVDSVESGWFPLTTGAERNVGGVAFVLAWAAMVVLPVFLVASGVATRRRPRLAAGLLAAAATAATAVDAVDPRPLWAVLLAGGLILVAALLLLRRLFRRAPDRSLHGWTAEPLFDDAGRATALEFAGVAAALSPEARELPAEEGFRGRGGEQGGGGATVDF